MYDVSDIINAGATGFMILNREHGELIEHMQK